LHAGVYCKAVHTKHPENTKKTSSQEPFSLQREITSDTFGTPKHQQAPTCNVLTPSGAIWGVPFGGGCHSGAQGCHYGTPVALEFLRVYELTPQNGKTVLWQNHRVLNSRLPLTKLTNLNT